MKNAALPVSADVARPPRNSDKLYGFANAILKYAAGLSGDARGSSSGATSSDGRLSARTVGGVATAWRERGGVCGICSVPTATSGYIGGADE
jgi:hypothetical protein